MGFGGGGGGNNARMGAENMGGCLILADLSGISGGKGRN